MFYNNLMDMMNTNYQDIVIDSLEWTADMIEVMSGIQSEMIMESIKYYKMFRGDFK